MSDFHSSNHIDGIAMHTLYFNYLFVVNFKLSVIDKKLYTKQLSSVVWIFSLCSDCVARYGMKQKSPTFGCVCEMQKAGSVPFKASVAVSLSYCIFVSICFACIFPTVLLLAVSTFSPIALHMKRKKQLHGKIGMLPYQHNHHIERAISYAASAKHFERR